MKIEFYLDKTGTLPKVIYLKWDHHEWQKLSDLSILQIEEIFDKIVTFNKVRNAFLQLKKHGLQNKRDILQQFILCNWTKLDRHYDITDYKVQFENISCPFKSSGNCPYKGKGIICIKN